MKPNEISYSLTHSLFFFNSRAFCNKQERFLCDLSQIQPCKLLSLSILCSLYYIFSGHFFIILLDPTSLTSIILNYLYFAPLSYFSLFFYLSLTPLLLFCLLLILQNPSRLEGETLSFIICLIRFFFFWF